MSLISSLFGDGGSSDRSAALQQFKDIPLPILEKYYPEVYKQVVQLNPQLEQTVTQAPSAMDSISTDPRLKQAQMNALLKLQGIADDGGMTLQDKANLTQITNDANVNLKGNEDAITQNLAARGMSGGPMEMIARENAAQNASNRASQQGLDIAAQAQQRVLTALMNAGTLGGQMQQQDFSQQAQRAQADDAISRFNAQNTQQVRNNNVNTQNQAQEWNATTAQNNSNANTQLHNQAQQYNLNLPQQNFNNQMTRASGMAGQYNNTANAKDNERNGDMQLVGNLINAGASAYGGYQSGKKG